MFLSVKEMEIRKVHFDGSFEPGRIEFEESGLRQVGPLEARGTAELLQNTGGEVRVRGHFRVEVEADCDRCLGLARYGIERDFDLFYRPQPGGPPDEEIEIDEGELELAFYSGEGFELGDLLKEQVLLALPMQRLCRPECRGICAVCGSSRNETACQCEQKPADERWSALRGLHVSRQG